MACQDSWRWSPIVDGGFAGVNGRCGWCSIIGWVVLCILSLQEALASGLFLGPRGVRPLARAGAFVAGADDAFALSYNAAGLGLADPTIQVEASMPWHTTRFDRQTSLSGTNAATTVKGKRLVPVIPAIGFVHGLDALPRLRFGVGVMPFLPLLQNWPEKGADGGAMPQRYAVLDYKGSLLSMLAAGVAYRLGDDVFLGCALQLLAGSFATRMVASTCDGVICTQPENPDYDTTIQVQARGIVVPGVQIGVIGRIGSSLRFGLSWESPKRIRRTADLRLRLPSSPVYDGARISTEAPKAKISMDLPMRVRTGLEARLARLLRVELALVWEAWSIHDQIQVEPQGIVIQDTLLGDYALGNLSIERRFQDAWSARLGGELTPQLGRSRPLSFRFGLAYESSAVPARNLTAMSVDLDKVLLGLGFGVFFKQVRLDVTYAYVHMRSETVADSVAQQINPTRPVWPGISTIGNGTYRSRMQIVGVGLRYQLGANEDHQLPK